MVFVLFNFHVNNDGVTELISISDSMPPAANPSASPAIKGKPSTTTPLMTSEEEPRLETLTPWWRGDDGVKASSLIHGNGDRNFCDQVDVGMCSK
jgi:hypothetical protein